MGLSYSVTFMGSISRRTEMEVRGAGGEDTGLSHGTAEGRPALPHPIIRIESGAGCR